MPAALVFAAASLEPSPRLRARLAALQRPIVIAADAGATTALEFGFTPDLVIGDFDSLDLARVGDLPTETFPRDKDFTDGELAIQRALQRGASELYLVGFVGGPRLDQELASLFMLTRIDIPAVLLDAHNECSLLHGPANYAWPTEQTEIVSLIPLSDSVDGVTTQGLRWPLNGETLWRGQTRGVSNEPNANRASVKISGGLLLLARHFPL